jgi:hypothetical protein
MAFSMINKIHVYDTVINVVPERCEMATSEHSPGFVHRRRRRFSGDLNFQPPSTYDLAAREHLLSPEEKLLAAGSLQMIKFNRGLN